jgi:anti-sigma regulatory factor (Ser/Thr protein kinase)
MGENVRNPGSCASAVDPPQIRLQLMSNPLYLSGARELVSAVAKRLGFADEACGKIALAVDEALCNVIRHGYGRDPNRPIWVSIWPVHECGCGGPDVHPGALKIVIEDEARQVDPSVIRSRDLEEIRPGGLGVHIIRAVMDEVKYEKRDSVGMRLTMIKRRREEADNDQAEGDRKESEGG